MSDKKGPYTVVLAHEFLKEPAFGSLIVMSGKVIRAGRQIDLDPLCYDLNQAYAAGAASKEPERDSAWIIEGCREAWKEGGFEDKDRADERFRTKYQTFAVGWTESRMRLIGPTPDPDAHLTGEAYLKAKQERCAVWMKGQSAEEIEREMRGEPSDNHRAFQRALDLQGMAMSALRALEPSKAILLPMGEEVDAILLSDCDNMYHEDHGSVMFATTDCVTKLFANTKAVSIEAIKKEVYQWRARHFNNPKEQADDLDSRLNNLTK